MQKAGCRHYFLVDGAPAVGQLASALGDAAADAGRSGAAGVSFGVPDVFHCHAQAGSRKQTTLHQPAQLGCPISSCAAAALNRQPSPVSSLHAACCRCAAHAHTSCTQGAPCQLNVVDHSAGGSGGGGSVSCGTAHTSCHGWQCAADTPGACDPERDVPHSRQASTLNCVCAH